MDDVDCSYRTLYSVWWVHFDVFCSQSLRHSVPVTLYPYVAVFCRCRCVYGVE